MMRHYHQVGGEAGLQGKRPFRFLTLFLGLSLFFGVITILLHSVMPEAAADTPNFTEEFRGTGRYGIVAKGVGTRGDPNTLAWTGRGDITIDIPATATILVARLIWTGRTDLYDADGVMLSVDGGADTVITADPTHQFEQLPWCCSGSAQRHESADITGFIQTGSHIYTVSDHEHGYSMDPTNDYLNYGVGIWVIYQDAGEELGEVIVFEGQDSFFQNFAPPLGPHTEVRCADFTPDTKPRTVDITHLVSGVDIDFDPLRSDAFWVFTGSLTDTKPLPNETPGLIGQNGSIGYDPLGQYPLRSSAGLEWDNLETRGFPVPANHAWACFQIESGDSQDLAGLGNAGSPASGMWNLFAIRVFTSTSSIDLIAFDGQADSQKNVRIDWKTADEVDNYGFNLYRGSSDQFADADMVAFVPSAFSSGETQYSVDDYVPTYGFWYYWLEDIDTKGQKTLHGPIVVHASRFSYTYLPYVQR